MFCLLVLFPSSSFYAKHICKYHVFMILEESLNHPSYKSGSSNDESFIYSAFINSVIMDDKDTERIRMLIFLFAFTIFEDIFFLSSLYNTNAHTTCQWIKYIRILWFRSILFHLIFFINECLFFNSVHIHKKIIFDECRISQEIYKKLPIFVVN